MFEKKKDILCEPINVTINILDKAFEISSNVISNLNLVRSRTNIIYVKAKRYIHCSLNLYKCFSFTMLIALHNVGYHV